MPSRDDSRATGPSVGLAPCLIGSDGFHDLKGIIILALTTNPKGLSTQYFRVWLLGPESLNIRYLDPMGKEGLCFLVPAKGKSEVDPL